MEHGEHDPEERASARRRRRSRALAAGIYRRARVNLGLTQEQAAERGHCGERSQRDRELGGCSLGALESIVAQAESMGQRLELRMVPLGHVQPANDNDAPPSMRPLAKCEARAKRVRRRVS